MLLTRRSPLHNAPIYYNRETDTTMADARALRPEEAPDGTAVLTSYQRAGRGRRAGRVWHSEFGESLMFTLLRRSVREPQVQSLRMAAAVSALLEARWHLSPQIKWPNDVLVGGRKICGVLADYADGVLTIGVGLNLLQRSFPEALESIATSVLRSCDGCEVLPDDPLPEALSLLLCELLEHYVAMESDWYRVLDTRLAGRGLQATVRRPDGSELSGVVSGISRGGELLVEAEKLYRLAAGEVFLVQ
jgi:BirA family biotin operon repressor/biotin-[acetyl-CoA-carboxylase] ligase